MSRQPISGNPQIVAEVGDRVGEGIVWIAEESAAYWTDMTRFLVHRWSAGDHSVSTWEFEEPVVALARTDRPGILLAALGSRLILWRPSDGQRMDHGPEIPGWPRVRFNDGRPDPAGNFWVGSMWNNISPQGQVSEVPTAEGVLYRVDGNGEMTEFKRDIGISNTVCWSPDGGRFYFADTLANRIWSYDYDVRNASISNEREFFSGFARGLPDGSCVDSAGYLWNCRFGGGCVVRIAPDGTIDRVVEMPCKNVTTCTFGGDALTTLLITTANPEGSDGGSAGHLFALEVDAPGLPERSYRVRGAPIGSNEVNQPSRP
ncbi:MAG: SMP-30/gluconolactonase/LRE family protein [Bauldia sp.]|nr:SMP-30/gluconolactonase/LRE family protein [Bauldia sp.]